MRYSVHVTKKAQTDMDNTAEYIRTTLSNPQAAYNLVLKTSQVLDTLAAFPESNRIVDDALLRSWGIRFAMVNNYLAFYVIIDDTVHIVRFLYSRRNWAYILKQGIDLE
ncbi:MAG: type II toxin-antitoxin system RelE/ParE family toxin [Oscillospiraceae bacterium]|nr:type II toxin-antitoxin system RelE/ParE family toxin [Oscillospiraceae bacterium]